jgi:signal transduction histidine kinase
MKIIVEEKSVYAYARRIAREKSLALTAIVTVMVIGFTALLLHVAENTYPDLVSNIMYPLTSLLGSTWAFITAYRIARGPLELGPRHVLAWLLVGMGLMANCLGGLYYTYLERSGQTILVPSLSDIGFTLFYPLIFAGLFLMPTPQQFRWSIVLDSLIVTLCTFGVSWFFFISRVVEAQVEAQLPPAALITIVSYPFWDMLLILAIVLLIYRRANACFSLSFFLLGAGILANICADTGYAYTAAIGTYSTIKFLIDPLWYLGFLLVGFSGLYYYSALVNRAYQEGSFSLALAKQLQTERQVSGEKRRQWWLLQQILIYLPLAILLTLTLYSEYLEYRYDQKSSFLLMGITTLVGILVTLRSLVATRENESLLTALARARAEQEAIAEEQTRLYTELRLTHKRLQELDRLKDQFMVTASHELRTPLTAIQGYLDLLATYGETITPEQRREFILKAQHGGEELVLLLNNVMDTSRLEVDAGIRPAHLQTVDVYEAVQSVMEIIEPQLIYEQRKVILSLPPALTVRADPTRLRQVLLNVSVNALKYSPPGSPLTLKASRMPGPAPRVIISVIDKGNGIAPQDQERLFQRFVRLERDLNSTIRGSGLGLYISRRLIEAMGGKIWVESSGVAGEGSCFNIQLPMPG